MKTAFSRNLVGLSLLACGVAAGSWTASADNGAVTIDQSQAKALFTEKLYPYIRRNCAECHSEAATYPHGPDHSHSDPAIAFRKFNTFVNWDNVENSRAVKMMTTRHFCVDYNYGCKNADTTVQVFNGLLRDYVRAVKQASLVANPPKGTVAQVDAETEEAQEIGVRAFMFTTKRTALRDGRVTFDLGPVLRLKSDAKGEISLVLEGRFEPYGHGYSRLVSLGLWGRSGVFSIKGIHFLINGQPVTVHTGFERIDRAVTFDGVSSRLDRAETFSQELAVAHPILKVKDGDEIAISFTVLKQISEFPTRLCSDSQLNESVVSRNDLIRELGWKLLFNFYVERRILCQMVESRIDFANPRRSILLSEIASIEEYGGRTGRVLSDIQGWIEDWISRAATESQKPTHGLALFRAAGCANCHTDKENGGLALGGGVALKISPFGTFYTPNISADREAGIGKWSDVDFILAMRKGVRPSDGRPYYPTFPYHAYSKMTDKDLLDIKDYIFSQPRVSTRNRDHDVSLIYRVRELLWAWQKLYFPDPQGKVQVDQKTARGPFVEDPLRSRSWNRGAYLAEAVAHCAECHTPRDSAGGLVLSKWMTGDPTGPTGKPIPDITRNPRAEAGKWSKEDWERFLSTGYKPNGKVARGEMAEIVEGLDLLSADDRAAIAEYMMSFDGANK